jgi:hypothetical protein
MVPIHVRVLRHIRLLVLIAWLAAAVALALASRGAPATYQMGPSGMAAVAYSSAHGSNQQGRHGDTGERGDCDENEHSCHPKHPKHPSHPSHPSRPCQPEGDRDATPNHDKDGDRDRDRDRDCDRE